MLHPLLCQQGIALRGPTGNGEVKKNVSVGTGVCQWKLPDGEIKQQKTTTKKQQLNNQHQDTSIEKVIEACLQLT